MKKFFWLLVLLGALLLSALPVSADDGFYVIGGRPSVGTRITSLPYQIKAPGYYYLGGNLTCPAGQDGITFASGVDNVTIDLMGFCLNGPTGSWTNTGISMNGRKNVEVRNGRMTYWGNCIVDSGTGSGHRVINVRVQCYDQGVNLGGSGHLIESCTAYNCIKGLAAGNGVISGCTVIGYAPTTYGISGSGTISNNVVLDCTGASAVGIVTSGPTTISYNQVTNCTTGISPVGGGSAVANVVLANSGQTGILFSATNAGLYDQNSSSGAGTHVYGSGPAFGGMNAW
jgi:hypothetical protein